jgi:hypothetical protein
VKVTSFRRYTNLAATIHLLHKKQITLLNPATWDDRNDAYFMAEYKRHKKAKTVLALCFAEQSETYHHWRVFSHGSDGVCIEFDKDKLLSTFDGDASITSGNVEYKLIKDVSSLKKVSVDKLPFWKRAAYQDESEFRVVYVDTIKNMEYKNYVIDIDWITRITLSPWMSKSLRGSVTNSLQSIAGCSDVDIFRSTLVENETWKSVTARAR